MEQILKDNALKILKNLDTDDIKKIKSPIGVFNLSCQLVEEAYQRSKNKFKELDSSSKKEIAISISHALLIKLKEEGIIEPGLYQEVFSVLQSENLAVLESVIDDIIDIWKDNDNIVTVIKRCFLKRRVKKRKLEHVSLEE